MKVIRIALEWILSGFIGIAAALLLSVITSSSVCYVVGAVLAALIVGTIVAGVFCNANAPVLYGVVAGIIAFCLWCGVEYSIEENQDLDMFIALLILSLPYIITSYFALVIYPKIK
ncbi:MAG: hypothetical protein J6D20_04465 [Clostridia bacterium]|nr:hypothetical protein [Clostridia bacterium]